MKKIAHSKNLFLIAFAIIFLSACSSTTATGGGGGSASCVVDVDCSDHCSFTGTWATGAIGSHSNGGFCASGACYCCYAQFDVDPSTGASTEGRCLGCNEVGSNCSADISYACYSTEDVCLYDY